MTRKTVIFISGGILFLIILQVFLLPLNYPSEEMCKRAESIYDCIIHSETIRNEFLCHGIRNYQVSMNSTKFRHHFFFIVTWPLSKTERESLRKRIVAHLQDTILDNGEKVIVHFKHLGRIESEYWHPCWVLYDDYLRSWAYHDFFTLSPLDFFQRKIIIFHKDGTVRFVNLNWQDVMKWNDGKMPTRGVWILDGKDVFTESGPARRILFARERGDLPDNPIFSGWITRDFETTKLVFGNLDESGCIDENSFNDRKEYRRATLE